MIHYKRHTCPALERAIREQKMFYIPGSNCVARPLPGCRGGRGRAMDRCPYCSAKMQVEVRTP
jgi:hypothetical protein